MRVITEEMLDKKYEDAKQKYAECDMSQMYVFAREITVIEQLITEFQELDQLTVSKLRPMSELTIPYESVLIKIKENDLLQEGYVTDEMDHVWIGEMFCLKNECDGWIPLPQYKPEQP